MSNSIEEVKAALRRLNPSRVRVWRGDEHTDVAVPTRRRRWEQVVAAVEAYGEWSRVELLDKGGAVLGVVEGAAGAAPDDAPAAGGDREERLLALLLRGQREVLTFRDRETSAILTQMGRMLELQMEATRNLVEVYRAQVEVAAEAAAVQARSESVDGDTIAQLVDAAPKLLPLLPMLMRQATKGPPNGT